MCIACYLPADKTLERERCRTMSLNNPDGSGFAYVKDGKLFMEKGFNDFDDFWQAFEPVQKNNQCLVHFRVASAGNKDASNCHPFLVTPDLAIIHNGTIQDYNEKDNPKSDTCLFAENILEELVVLAGPKFFLSPIIQYLLLKTIGDSRMVFLDAGGDSVIINESKGITEDGVWYSNDSYKKVKKKEVSKSNHKKNEVKDGTPFTNNSGNQGKQRFGYLFADSGNHLLTSTEIHKAVKHYHKKLKRLVELGLVLRVALGNDGLPLDSQNTVEGEAGLELWLKNHPNYGSSPEILEGEIIPEESYSG